MNTNVNKGGSFVVSIDPGTRNLAVCLLEYNEKGVAVETMEDFLNHISLRQLSFIDLGTNHINTASVRFKAACTNAHELEWLPRVYREHGAECVSVVIEQQGSLHSPITQLCHCIHGFFLGMQAVDHNAKDARGVVYVDYPAAAKFRGDWTLVQPRGGVRFDFKGCGSSDPVKRAAVEACERVMTYFRRSPAFNNMLDRVVDERRTHDMCDCVLQGVSYLFRRHVQKHGSSTQRAQPSLTLPLNDPSDPDETTASLLVLPRKQGRKTAASTRTTAVRSGRVLKKLKTCSTAAIATAATEPGEDIAW
jgi:hypothetical protein